MNTKVENLNTESFEPKMIGYKIDFEIGMMMFVFEVTGEAHNQFYYYLDPLKEKNN